jgi:hypothetical protein
MERDEVYIPKTREDLDIPKKPHDEINWDEIFGDTPIYTLYMLIRQQVLSFPAYLREFHASWDVISNEACSFQRLRSENLPKMDQPLRP